MKATHKPALDAYYTPAALLRGAASYLSFYGWTTGEIFATVDDTTPFPAACAIGAINIAAFGSPLLSCDDDADSRSVDSAIIAARVFAAWIDPEYSTPDVGHRLGIAAIDVIGDWNDYAGRTCDEVIKTLNDAAADWEATHPTGGAR
ncbi:DUF6197 family protein [Winogradskya humida]|uniref:Uncharacterized protein n=1 Tax=Winogradskya humida TaxID=113566 RepID=A0ABQ3ZU62_9ACTN|nr:hypothetical protein [Actinoplanes humidus]GIE22127.1 hypothetical protein Ahu01nite_052290 [Actinoplanes humidus]